MFNLKDFVEAMSASWPVALAIFLGSGATLFGEYLGIPYLGMLPSWLLGSAFLVCVFSASIVVVSLLQFIIAAVYSRIRHAENEVARRSHIERMWGLPDDELHILIWAAQQNRQIFLAELNHPLVEPLVSKAYVQIGKGTHSVVQWPYAIPEYIWAALREPGVLPVEQFSDPFRDDF